MTLVITLVLKLSLSKLSNSLHMKVKSILQHLKAAV